MSFDPTHKPRKREGPQRINLERVVQNNKSKFAAPEEEAQLQKSISDRAQKKKEQKMQQQEQQQERVNRLAAPKPRVPSPQQKQEQPAAPAQQQQRKASVSKQSQPQPQSELTAAAGEKSKASQQQKKKHDNNNNNNNASSSSSSVTVVGTSTWHADAATASTNNKKSSASSAVVAAAAASTIDEYGKGHPSDRLVFGYSPAVTAEAVAFHSQFSPQQWRKARKDNFRTRCLRTGQQLQLEHQKLMRKMKEGNNGKKQTAMIEDASLHFEPDMSVVQLRLYWMQRARDEQKMLARPQTVATAGAGAAATSGNNSRGGAFGLLSSGGGLQKEGPHGTNQFGRLLAEMFGDTEFVADQEDDDIGQATTTAAVAGNRRQRND